MFRSQLKYTAKTKRGFTLVEALVATAIFAFVFISFFNLLSVAQTNFFNIDANFDLRNSLRQASEKIALELRNSGYQNGVAQFALLSGQGTKNSDIIRFSVPILCSSTSTLLNTNGVPAAWGAPLFWECYGNYSYKCMNNVDSCATLAYKYVQYSIAASTNRYSPFILQRQVLDSALNVVSGSTTNIGTTNISSNIVNLKTSLSADGHIITFTLTGQKRSPAGRTLTVTYTNEVLLNNVNG
jgi:prepilin-type N-terminal cleavage/methylation domain-containing protein